MPSSALAQLPARQLAAEEIELAALRIAFGEILRTMKPKARDRAANRLYRIATATADRGNVVALRSPVRGQIGRENAARIGADLIGLASLLVKPDRRA